MSHTHLAVRIASTLSFLGDAKLGGRCRTARPPFFCVGEALGFWHQGRISEHKWHVPA